MVLGGKKGKGKGKKEWKESKEKVFTIDGIGLFDPFVKLHMWSDGCGKHFKTYPSQVYALELQTKLKKKLSNFVWIFKIF
jgi:hypothetical protein